MTNGPTIYPTHACFDDVVGYVNELLRQEPIDTAKIDELRIVHGLVVDPDGERCAHAWLEAGDEVIQGGIYEGDRIWFLIKRADFDAHYTIAKSTRYTVVEAMELQRVHHDGTGGGDGAALAKALKDICTQTTAAGTCTFAQVLAEEASEALVETDPEALRHELVQTAAVCVKWIESLDRRRLAREPAP